MPTQNTHRHLRVRLKEGSGLTHYSEIKSGLAQAIAVLQFDGVAATVLLLPGGDGQLTTAVIALYPHSTTALLDLRWTQIIK